MVSAWPSAVLELRAGSVKVVPLGSIEDLTAEGIPRGRAAKWVPQCVAGRLRLFALRHETSGRIGICLLRYNARSGIWVLHMSGSARKPFPSEAAALMVELHAAYQEKTGGKPHPPLGAPKEVERLLARMDLEDAEQEMADNGPGVVLWQSDWDRPH